VLRSSQIFVLPSFFEGLPLVVLEALACGCRIVMTDLPGLDSWLSPSLEENGFVARVKLPRLVRVDEPEPADLPEYVKNLSDAISLQLRRSINRSPDWRACVMPCIAPMGWEAIFRKIEAVYSRVIQKYDSR
jgi:glycosyltransferase involved in cell wall biosynthesis